MTAPNISFREVQQFRQKWLWFFLVPTVLITSLPFIEGIYKQLILGQTWGTKPLSDTALLILGPFFILLGFGILYLFYVLKLETIVLDDGLYLRFYPLTKNKMAFNEILSCEVRTYRPIREYGGWGIKYGGKKRGWVYNVSGNKGVQLKLLNKKPLLIGSQQAEELAAVIRSKMK